MAITELPNFDDIAKKLEKNSKPLTYEVAVAEECLLLDTGDTPVNQSIRRVVREQIAKMETQVLEEIQCKISSVDLERKEVEVAFLRDKKVQNYIFPLENLQQVGLIDPLPEDDVVFRISRVGHGIPFGEFSYVPPTNFETVAELRAKFPPGFFDAPSK